MNDENYLILSSENCKMTLLCLSLQWTKHAATVDQAMASTRHESFYEETGLVWPNYLQHNASSG